MSPWFVRPMPVLALAIAAAACQRPVVPPPVATPVPPITAWRAADPLAPEDKGPILTAVPTDPPPSLPPGYRPPPVWPDPLAPSATPPMPTASPPVPEGLAWPGLPAWPQASIIPFPCDPDSHEPAFDPTHLDGLVMGVFDLDRKQRLELPALDGLIVASQTYLLDGQRTLYFVTSDRGDMDIWKYDLPTNRIDTLPEINTDDDERALAVSPDGRVMVYVQGKPGKGRLCRYEMQEGVTGPYLTAMVPEEIAPDPQFPSVNATGDLVAYQVVDGDDQDIRFYDFRAHREVTPPFVNTPANESFPWLTPDGRGLWFVSDRGGDPEIYMCDLRDGWIQHLTDISTPGSEIAPAYIGGTAIEFVSDRDGRFRMYLYDWVRHRVDLLPF